MLSDMPRIFWAGDSTVKQNDFTSYPQSGIGQGFYLFAKKEVLIVNRAENGRSTKSFIDEGRLEYIRKNIRKGDFLFVQFGHNDEKIADPTRYTEPQTTFKENLRQFISTAREVGAYPVLITPLYRRKFVEEHKLIDGTHGAYPEAIKEMGIEMKVPVIDLCEISRKHIENEGDEPSKRWFMHLAPGEYSNYPDGKSDDTHLKYEGAVEFAKIIAAELHKLGGVYDDILVDAKDVYEDPALLID